MWITKERYHHLLERENDADYYFDLAYRYETKASELSEQLTLARAEIEMYQQKYADEVQKRLCLIGQIEGEKQNGDP